MEREIFYKDQYDKSLDRKNEINSSLSTPIGILTALVAGLFYATTNFNFEDNRILSSIFVVIATVAVIVLSISIYRLIRAFSDFHNDQEYAYLNDADLLDNYYQALITFYDEQNGAIQATTQQQSQKDFDDYLIKELIKNAAINQINNRLKTYHRFKCHQYMIYALIVLSLLIIPFGIDFGINKGKDKVQKVKIDSIIPVSLTIKYKDTVLHLNLNTIRNGRPNRKKTDTTNTSTITTR